MKSEVSGKLKVLYVTTGRINPNGDLYYPPLVANQINSLKPLLGSVAIEVIYSLSPFFIFRKVLELRKMTRQVDVVHAQYGSLTSLVAYLAKRGKPLVISFGGSDLLGSSGKGWGWLFRNWITRQMGIWAANDSDRIIVKSQTLLMSLPPSLHNKTKIIPNGVDTRFFFPTSKHEARKRLGWKEYAYYILFTPSRANNVLVKNLPLATEVVKMVSEKLNEVKMEFILDKAPGEVAEMMNGADCLLLTSLHEGSPNIIKEAMACNLPIVTVHVGDVMERLWSVKNAFVVDSYNQELIGAQVEYVLRTNERTNGYEELIRQQLTSENVALKIMEVYNKVVK